MNFTCTSCIYLYFHSCKGLPATFSSCLGQVQWTSSHQLIWWEVCSPASWIPVAESAPVHQNPTGFPGVKCHSPILSAPPESRFPPLWGHWFHRLSLLVIPSSTHAPAHVDTESFEIATAKAWQKVAFHSHPLLKTTSAVKQDFYQIFWALDPVDCFQTGTPRSRLAGVPVCPAQSKMPDWKMPRPWRGDVRTRHFSMPQESIGASSDHSSRLQLKNPFLG